MTLMARGDWVKKKKTLSITVLVSKDCIQGGPASINLLQEKAVTEVLPFQKVHICTLFDPKGCILVPFKGYCPSDIFYKKKNSESIQLLQGISFPGISI